VSALDHIKKDVRALDAYTLVERTTRVKVNQNESPWDLPDEAKRRVLETALTRPWSRYPAFDPRELLARLAQHAGWRSDGILAGNGSNELIEALLLVTVGAQTAVVIPEPTFTLYALLTKVLGGEAVRVPLTSELTYDVAAIREVRRQRRAPLSILCSPNNPTGCSVSLEDVSALCEDTDGLVVVDEAYHEFSGVSFVPLLESHPNLVVLRTFSKALSLAGLRVGYLMASPALVVEINKGRLPYNINFFSQLGAMAALDEWPLLEERVRRIVAERARLADAIGALRGVRVYPSDANFLLVEFAGRTPKEILDAVFARGVLVRDVSSYPMLERCLRVSVGSPEENSALVAALEAALA
jgi:histidinol-phosphate aminotransferase